MKFRLMSHMCKLCIQVYETQRDTHIYAPVLVDVDVTVNMDVDVAANQLVQRIRESTSTLCTSSQLKGFYKQNTTDNYQSEQSSEAIRFVRIRYDVVSV